MFRPETGPRQDVAAEFGLIPYNVPEYMDKKDQIVKQFIMNADADQKSTKGSTFP